MWNQDQRPVVEIIGEDYKRFSWKNDAELISLTVKIPAIHLTSGKYTISIAIFDHDLTKVIARMDNAVSFVMGHSISTGCESLHAGTWLKEHV